MWKSCIIVGYVLTVCIGLFGNLWVIGSVLRSRRPRSLGRTSPSDRLRTYIAVLAVVDLTVLMALFVKTIYLVMADLRLDHLSCQAMFLLDNAVKFASITCLCCISFERYITIRKPFCSQIRKRCIRLTPLIGLCVLSIVLVVMVLQMQFVTVSQDSRTCTTRGGKWWSGILTVLVGFFFLIQLSAISINYSQIVRHVKRKFVKRKARVVAHSRTRESLVSEPRYLRGMTSAIARVAFFHLICWLPFCVLQFIPAPQFSSHILVALTQFDKFSEFGFLAWTLFICNWLTYVNGAGNWIFYAAMNRDLRNLIRYATERRKRSTMSQHNSPGNLHRSLRQQVTSSLRFLQSMHSYRSSAGGSFDESACAANAPAPTCGGISNSSPKSSLFSADITQSPKLPKEIHL